MLIKTVLNSSSLMLLYTKFYIPLYLLNISSLEVHTLSSPICRGATRWLARLTYSWICCIGCWQWWRCEMQDSVVFGGHWSVLCGMIWAVFWAELCWVLFRRFYSVDGILWRALWRCLGLCCQNSKVVELAPHVYTSQITRHTSQVVIISYKLMRYCRVAFKFKFASFIVHFAIVR